MISAMVIVALPLPSFSIYWLVQMHDDVRMANISSILCSWVAVLPTVWCDLFTSLVQWVLVSCFWVWVLFLSRIAEDLFAPKTPLSAKTYSQYSDEQNRRFSITPTAITRTRPFCFVGARVLCLLFAWTAPIAVWIGIWWMASFPQACSASSQAYHWQVL